VLSFLFGHLVVKVVVRINSINPLKARALTDNLLLALALRSNSLHLNSVDRLVECTRQYLKLKNAEEISDQVLAVGTSLRTQLCFSYQRIAQFF
jgi:hypothetical protein